MTNRVPQDAPLDPWAEISLEQERRATMQLEAKIEADRIEAQQKADRRESLLTGAGIIAGLAVVAAGLFGLGWLIADNAGNARQDKIDEVRARNELIQNCASIDNDVERQLCYLAAGIDLTAEGESE